MHSPGRWLQNAAHSAPFPEALLDLPLLPAWEPAVVDASAALLRLDAPVFAALLG